MVRASLKRPLDIFDVTPADDPQAKTATPQQGGTNRFTFTSLPRHCARLITTVSGTDRPIVQ